MALSDADPEGFENYPGNLAPAAQAKMVNGLLDAAMRRPSSWTGADAVPSTDAWCDRCHGREWRRDGDGWRCSTCHPPPAQLTRGWPA